MAVPELEGSLLRGPSYVLRMVAHAQMLTDIVTKDTTRWSAKILHTNP